MASLIVVCESDGRPLQTYERESQGYSSYDEVLSQEQCL